MLLNFSFLVGGYPRQCATAVSTLVCLRNTNILTFDVDCGQTNACTCSASWGIRFASVLKVDPFGMLRVIRAPKRPTCFVLISSLPAVWHFSPPNAHTHAFPLQNKLHHTLSLLSLSLPLSLPPSCPLSTVVRPHVHQERQNNCYPPPGSPLFVLRITLCICISVRRVYLKKV